MAPPMDATEQQVYCTYLAQGGTQEQVREFLTHHARALEATYQAVLGRAVDASGRGTWSGVLAAGGTLGQVRASIAQSTEAEGMIRNLYYSYTGQELPANQLQLYKDYLRDHGRQMLLAHIEDNYIRNMVLPVLNSVLPLLLGD